MGRRGRSAPNGEGAPRPPSFRSYWPASASGFPALGISTVAVDVLVAGGLSIGATAGILFAVGCGGVFVVAAEQPYLPDLVPRRTRVLADARVGQSLTVAESSGPALGGALVGTVGPVDAAAVIFTAAVLVALHSPLRGARSR